MWPMLRGHNSVLDDVKYQLIINLDETSDKSETYEDVIWFRRNYIF